MYLLFSAWLKDEMNDTIQTLSNRISAITHLNMEQAEDLQVKFYSSFYFLVEIYVIYVCIHTLACTHTHVYKLIHTLMCVRTFGVMSMLFFTLGANIYYLLTVLHQCIVYISDSELWYRWPVWASLWSCQGMPAITTLFHKYY